MIKLKLSKRSRKYEKGYSEIKEPYNKIIITFWQKIYYIANIVGYNEGKLPSRSLLL
jgi:hypothetical protein